MKKKRLYIFILILILIILFSTAFLCQLIDQALFKFSPEEEEVMQEREVAEAFEWQDIEIEYMKKKEREMQETKENLLKDKKDYFEEIDKWWEEEYNKGLPAGEDTNGEEQIIKDKPLTYFGEYGVIGFDIAIDFNTAKVTGGLRSIGAYDTLDADIDGTINLETLFVDSTFSGFFNDSDFKGSITGTVSEDLNTIDCILESNIFNFNFTAYRYN